MTKREKTWQRLKARPTRIHPYVVRQQVLAAIRSFFLSRDFLEVETPLLAAQPGMEPFLEPFETRLKFATGQEFRAFLLTNPEYAMKKLLAAGLPRIFQISKCFRNQEGLSGKHNPEFTIMEWYRANADYTDIMEDCEQLFLSIAKQVLGTSTLVYGDVQYALAEAWERLSVVAAFARYAQIDEDTLLNDAALLRVAKQKGYVCTSTTTWEEVFHQIFLNEVEPYLGKTHPTILYDYPAKLPSLARLKPSDPRFVERFEFYVAGMELGNAFSELIDPDQQAERLTQEAEQRRVTGKTTYGKDEDFLTALRSGMPLSAGIGVGIDRIAMLFANVQTIQEVLFFPVEDLFELL